MSKKQDEFDRISDQINSMPGSNSDFDISQHLAKLDDLPDLGQIALYDYDSDLTIASQKGLEVIESLVDLYLGEFTELKNHPYIKNKIREDALVYAEMLFLSKMTRKNILTQLKQVDNGDNSARMHEVINQTIAQSRENTKLSQTQRSDLENSYKNFKNDLLEVIASMPDKKKKDDSSGQVIDSSKLNDMIKLAVLKKKD